MFPGFSYIQGRSHHDMGIIDGVEHMNMRRQVQEAMGHIHQDSLVPGADLGKNRQNPDDIIVQENRAPFTIKPGVSWEAVDRLHLPPEERTVAIGVIFKQ